ncbi:MAG: hypothetical protein AW08_00403 [Candidatus Accumulibacter adjunctus]|uniref:Uncharacterized protein n=1 Tax=Candidatus Accumulibacter adjunctus TaxID=1454001 RepID=A0A011N2S8_9PROT|nr:MAG: hypothetical protein AW08_00403 [Candidatus Accumulibacter adjunctus]
MLGKADRIDTVGKTLVGIGKDACAVDVELIVVIDGDSRSRLQPNTGSRQSKCQGPPEESDGRTGRSIGGCGWVVPDVLCPRSGQQNRWCNRAGIGSASNRPSGVVESDRLPRRKLGCRTPPLAIAHHGDVERTCARSSGPADEAEQPEAGRGANGQVHGRVSANSTRLETLIKCTVYTTLAATLASIRDPKKKSSLGTAAGIVLLPWFRTAGDCWRFVEPSPCLVRCCGREAASAAQRFRCRVERYQPELARKSASTATSR